MIRSRWFAVQAAALMSAAIVVSSSWAQGRCPYTAQFQLQMQMQVQNRFVPQQRQPQFQQPPFQPMLTPPRMPMNVQLPRQGFVPQFNVGMPRPPSFNTPALTARVPMFTPNINVNTQTTVQVQALTQSRILNFPTLQFNQLTWLVRTPNLVAPPNGNGIGGLDFNFIPQIPTWNIATGTNRMPTLGIGTARWNTATATRVPLTATRGTGNLTTGNRRISIPSLSFNQRPPLSVPTRPLAGGTNPVAANRPGVVGATPAKVGAPRVPTATANAKPGTGSSYLHVSGRVTFTCGSCHACKQNTKTTGLVGAQPISPVARPPVLPAQLAPPVLAARPVQRLVGQSPIVRQPAVPTVILQGPGRLPLPLPPLTINTTSLTLILNPLPTPTPVKTLIPSTSFTQMTASLRTDIASTVSETTSKVTTLETPHVVADLPPPLLPPLERSTATGLQLGDLVQTTALIVSDKANTPTSPLPPGPSLVQTLLLPPPLPSGATVSSGEVVQPVLDEPPVLPALVDTLILPPPLPPLPGE